MRGWALTSRGRGRALQPTPPARRVATGSIAFMGSDDLPELRGSGARLLSLSRQVARLRGARLCFGKPVRSGTRTVVPVASVFVAGGLGFGDGTDQAGEEGGGGGGGGTLQAKPVGFIDVSEGRARFRRIWTGETLLKTVRALAGIALVAFIAERRLRP